MGTGSRGQALVGGQEPRDQMAGTDMGKQVGGGTTGCRGT